MPGRAATGVLSSGTTYTRVSSSPTLEIEKEPLGSTGWFGDVPWVGGLLPITIVIPPGSGVPAGAPSIVIRVGRGNPGESVSVTFSRSRLRTSILVAASILLINVARSYTPGSTFRMTN